MSNTVVIHQPDFLPYLGFFHRLLKADLFILLDHVQFVHSNRGWTHRDKIKTPQGVRWITISVKKAPRETAINNVVLSKTSQWRENNLNLFRANYREAPFFDEIMPMIEGLYQKNHSKLVDITSDSILLLLNMFDIHIPIVYSSNMNPQKHKNDLIVELCNKVQATHYLSGVGAKDYFRSEPFSRSGIEVIWQNFNHPIYKQLHGEFLPYLSSIDLLFNCGIAKSRKILVNID